MELELELMEEEEEMVAMELTMPLIMLPRVACLTLKL